MLTKVVEDLIQRRKEKRFTQEDLAKLTGLSQQHISGIERGKVDPRLSTLLTLGLALDARLALTSPRETGAKNRPTTQEAPPSVVDDLRIED